MIDFSKIGSGSTVDTVLSPRDIFNSLPNKDFVKYQYPRDVQSQVWKKWFDRRNEESLILKMNTGSGKTVVGLLILKSCINEGKSPAVYVCPDKYLVKQVLDAAKELGVEATDNIQSPRFQSGKAVLVTNIYKLVNGKSVFGVGDEGAKIHISTLMVDDAHACLDTVEEQFTIKIESGTKLYDELFIIFKASLEDECESKAIEIENGDKSTFMQVPYWVWQDKISVINQILVKYSDSDNLKFIWPLIREDTKLCSCVVSAKEIEISPHFVPIHMIPSIVNADRKIFMTATLVDDSILTSHFAVPEEHINAPIVPESAGDIGDRMILLPQVINTDISDDDIKIFCKNLSTHYNVVVIVPSTFRSNYWRDVADLILTSENLYDGIESLKKSHVGLVVLLNRYDGIDLPSNSCRLLVIDGLPDVRRQIDKVKQSIMMGSTRHINNVIQKIEQGMGRGVRSNDDFCVVFLMGKSLTSHIYAQGAVRKFSPGTIKQIELSEQVAEQIKGKPIFEILNTMNYCLKRQHDWIAASKGVLAGLTYDEYNKADEITIKLRKAYDLSSSNKVIEAATLLSDLVNKQSDKKITGYLKQVLAEYYNLIDRAEAQKIQMSAINDNRRLLKPIDGIQYHKLSGSDDQATTCSDFLMSKYHDPNKLIIDVNGILDNLQFKDDSSNLFEENLKCIAKYIGFNGQRPEVEYKKGPDVLWNLGELKYLVIECKNESVSKTISKEYCNQLNGSCNWFESKYDTSCSYIPIIIHSSIVFEYAASPKPNTRVINQEKIEELVSSIRDFIKSIAINNELSNKIAIKTKLSAYKLKASDFVNLYTQKYKVKNQP